MLLVVFFETIIPSDSGSFLSSPQGALGSCTAIAIILGGCGRMCASVQFLCVYLFGQSWVPLGHGLER